MTKVCEIFFFSRRSATNVSAWHATWDLTVSGEEQVWLIVGMPPVSFPNLLEALRHGAHEERVGASIAVGQLLSNEGLRDLLTLTVSVFLSFCRSACSSELS